VLRRLLQPARQNIRERSCSLCSDALLLCSRIFQEVLAAVQPISVYAEGRDVPLVGLFGEKLIFGIA